MRRKRSSISILLLLSAIDMLSAALVCGVVLFVVLVGGQANESDAAGNGALAAPSLLLVYGPEGKPGPVPVSVGRPATPETASTSDPYLTVLFAGASFESEEYWIQPGIYRVSFRDSDHPFAIELYPGTGEAI